MIEITLKAALAKRKMTQQELSNLTGIRWPTICGMCNGKAKTISLHNLNLICSVLECNPSDVIAYTRTDRDRNHTGFNRTEYLAEMQKLHPGKPDNELVPRWP